MKWGGGVMMGGGGNNGGGGIKYHLAATSEVSEP